MKANQRVQKITKTLYNLLFYIEKIEILHVADYKWKFNKIVNSSIFFLSVLEEMKSSIYCLEIAKSGLGL